MFDPKNKKLFLLDMDGTLYLGDELFPETLPFLEKIKSYGARCAFMTNNSSKSASAYIEKLARLGISSSHEDFVTSVNATVKYLKDNYANKKIFTVGTRSFVSELLEEGIDVVCQEEDGVEVVLIGYDTELTYQKLVDACRLLDRGLPFIATNPDWVCPTADGYIPDCGSFCEMLKRATGRSPKFIGKPEVYMPLLALERYGVSKDEAVVVGDRLYTDVACGLNAGIDSIFVLSGEGTLEDIEQMHINPTLVCKNVGEIFN